MNLRKEMSLENSTTTLLEKSRTNTKRPFEKQNFPCHFLPTQAGAAGKNACQPVKICHSWVSIVGLFKIN